GAAWVARSTGGCSGTVPASVTAPLRARTVMLATLRPLVFDSALRTLRPNALSAFLVVVDLGPAEDAMGAGAAAASLLCAYALTDARTISAPPTILIAW